MTLVAWSVLTAHKLKIRKINLWRKKISARRKEQEEGENRKRRK